MLNFHAASLLSAPDDYNNMNRFSILSIILLIVSRVIGS